MKNNSSSGLGICGVLTIVFVVLKLVGVINWSWLWVLSPLWIDIVLTVSILIGFYFYFSHDQKRDKWDKWKFQDYSGSNENLRKL